MGRLVNATPRNSGEDHPTFDEARFLEDAGQIAARLQGALTADQSQCRNESEALASDSRQTHGSGDGPDPVCEPAHAETAPLEDTTTPESLRIYSDEDSGWLAEDVEKMAHEEISLARSESAAEQHRIRQDAEAEQTAREQGLAQRREEMALERLTHREELNRDRVRQLHEINASRAELEREREEAAQQLEREQREWDSRLERAQDELLNMQQAVEQDVARTLGELDREKSAWESQHQEMWTRLRNEELEQEQRVERVRTELSLLTERERKKLAARCQTVEQLKRETSENCKLKRAELENELLSRRTEWITQQQSERDQLDAEKAILQESVGELQTALHDRRQQHEHALRKERSEVERELIRQRDEHDIELALQRRQTSEWIQLETVKLEQQRQQVHHELDTERQRFDERIARESTRMEHEWEELRSSLDAERKEFEDARRTWRDERGHEAAILQAERHEIERLRTRLESEQDRIDAELNTLSVELERTRATHDEQLRRAEQMHKEGLFQAERELQGRRRMLEEKVQQTDAELTARCRQVEEELRSMRALHEKQLAHDKDAFAQACVRRDSELERETAEQQQSREKIEHERQELASRFGRAKRQFAENVERARKTFEAETSRVRQQLEQERRVLRSGLNQMNAQLVSVATSLDGVAAKIESGELNPSDGHQSTTELQSMLGESSDGTVEPPAGLPLMAELTIAPVEFFECADSVDVPAGESLDDIRESACDTVSDVASESPDVARDGVTVESAPTLGGEVHCESKVSHVTGEQSIDRVETSAAIRSDSTDVIDRASPDDSNGGATSEGACVVETRTTGSAPGTADRRNALEGYRSQLRDLQSQLQELAVARENTQAVE